MIIVSPAAELALDYRVHHLLTLAMSGHVLACSREGQCSLVAGDFSSLKSFHLSVAPKAVTLGPAADLVGVVTHDGLQMLDVLIQTPVASFDGSFEAVAFSPDDQLLWSVRRLDSDLVSVEVRNRQLKAPNTPRADGTFPGSESIAAVASFSRSSNDALDRAAGQHSDPGGWAPQA